MTRLASAFLLLLTVSSPLFAQPTNFGEPFPLTNTRYLSSGGNARIASNGSDATVFWIAEKRLYASRYVPGLAARVGRTVMPTSTVSGTDPFDVAWTGSHYLALVTGGPGFPAESQIVARTVDRNGVPQGEKVTVVTGQSPKVAFNGASGLLVFFRNGFRTAIIDAAGKLVTESQPLVDGATSISVVSIENGFAVLVTLQESARLLTYDMLGRIVADKTIAGRAFWGSLASDGRRMMALIRDDVGLRAISISANAVPGNTYIIEHGVGQYYIQNSSVIWNGNGWTIAYNLTSGILSEMYVLRLDTQGQTVLFSEYKESWPAQPYMAVANGKVLIAWMPRTRANVPVASIQAAEPIAVSMNTLASSEAITYAAARQQLLATASSANGILVVWLESGDGHDALRAGVRKHDGSWTERQIVSQSRGKAIAGSNGSEFVIAYEAYSSAQNGYTTMGILRLDGDGVPIGQPLVVDSFHPTDVAWNGRAYAFSEGATARLLTPGGSLLPATKLATDSALNSAIASDGDGFFTAWPIAGPMMCTCLPYSIALAGTSVNRDLNAIDPAPRKFVEDDAPNDPNVVWDGKWYVVVWSSPKGVYASRTLPGSAATTTHEITTAAAESTSAVAIAGGTAILWTADGSRHVRMLYQDGVLSPRVTLDRGLSHNAIGQLERIGNHALAYIYSAPNDAEPHHGSSRIMMAIGNMTPPMEPPHAPRARGSLGGVMLPMEPPHAPRARGSLAGTRSFVIEWDAPFEPVTGYRVEYRVGNGMWNEYDAFVSPEVRRFTYDTREGSDIMFRVRAFNDGGVSDYSNIVLPSTPPRRRAVR